MNLSNAMNFLCSYGGRLFAGCTDHPDNGMPFAQSKKQRISCIDELSLSWLKENCIFYPITNSIDEAKIAKQKIKDFFPKDQNLEVIIFADIFHLERAKFIWLHVFSDMPHIKITFHRVKCLWGADQAQFIQRNKYVWAFANFVALNMMKVFGIERLSKFKQPSR